MPYRMIKVKNGSASYTCPADSSSSPIRGAMADFRSGIFERGTQVGMEWEDKDVGVGAIALSPDGRTVAAASGGWDGAVKLWNIDTIDGAYTEICVLESRWRASGKPEWILGSNIQNFRVWDIESRELSLDQSTQRETLMEFATHPMAR